MGPATALVARSAAVAEPRRPRYRPFTDTLDFRVLGPLEVAANGMQVPLGGRKQRAVLALLLLHANKVVPIDRLIDRLWGEAPPESAANIVQGYISQLRKVLEPGRGRGEHELIVSQPPGYTLRIAPGQLDAERLSASVAEGRRLLEDGDPTRARECFRAALDLWRGPALADLAYEPFAQAEIERLEELRLAALEERIDADLALGRHEAVIAELHALIAEHPLRERLRGQLMAALYRCGRQAEALDAYRDARRLLDEELGVEPSPALRELERAILRHDPELGGPALPPAPIRRRPRRRLLIAACALALAATGAALGVALTRGGSAEPGSVVVYPHSVAVIEPARDAVVSDILVGGYPGPLAADGQYVYVANIGDATVSRIVSGSRTVYDTGSFSRATDLLALDGHLWAANGGAPGHTPPGVGPGTILDYGPGPTWKSIRIGPAQDGPEEQSTLATDGGLAVWAGNQDSATVREIDASLDQTLMTVHGISPGGLAAVGNIVWASDPSRNIVVRIDEGARAVTRRIAVPGRPTRVAADRKAVWVATRGKPAVWRIDARTGKVAARIPLAVIPWRITLGEGSVWLTGYRRRTSRSTLGGTVIRIDPATNRVVARIALGDLGADGILAAHGLVWVAVAPTP